MQTIIDTKLAKERYSFLCIGTHALQGVAVDFCSPLLQISFFYTMIYTLCRSAVDDMQISSPKGFHQYNFLMNSWLDCKADMLEVWHWNMPNSSSKIQQFSPCQYDKKIKTGCGRTDFVDPGLIVCMYQGIFVFECSGVGIHPEVCGLVQNSATFNYSMLIARVLVRVFFVFVFLVLNIPSECHAHIDFKRAAAASRTFEDKKKATVCPVCKKNFGMVMNKRRHCRHCLRVVCGKCAKLRAGTLGGPMVRLCTECLPF